MVEQHRVHDCDYEKYANGRTNHGFYQQLALNG